jgi:hypothetical protein
MAPPTQQADVKVGKAEPVRPSSPQHVSQQPYQNLQPPGARRRASNDAEDDDSEPVSDQRGTASFNRLTSLPGFAPALYTSLPGPVSFPSSINSHPSSPSSPHAIHNLLQLTNMTLCSPKMAPPVHPAYLISTATSIPILSSRYDSRRNIQNFPCLFWRVSYQSSFSIVLDPRNGRRRRGARVLQINRVRLLLPSRADLPKDGPESVSRIPLFLLQPIPAKLLPHLAP